MFQKKHLYKIASITLAFVLSLLVVFSNQALASADPVDEFCRANPSLSVCQNQATPEDLGMKILTFALWLAVIAALVFVVIGGIMYATSSGGPDKVKKAKTTLLYALIGMVIAISALVIINLTVNTTQNLFKGDSSTPQLTPRNDPNRIDLPY